MKKIILTLSLMIFTSSALAEGYSCVKRQKQDYSWGDTYTVPYTIVEGDDLQQATNDYNRYKSYTKYAIVEWPNGGYSAMELKSYEDDISDYLFSETKDQSGSTYKIKKAPSYGKCPQY